MWEVFQYATLKTVKTKQSKTAVFYVKASQEGQDLPSTPQQVDVRRV